ncbi:ATP-binding protein, partial [Lipingzhangella sp. LS1_29]|nr:ATP-binding protein [Lipingzhangella rawalii]
PDEARWRARLVLSELATNSLTHTRTTGGIIATGHGYGPGITPGGFAVWIFISTRFLHLDVRDAGHPHHHPTMQTEPRPDGSGYGLALVNHLARTSGTTHHPTHQTTWAEITWHTHPGQDPPHRPFHPTH